MVSSKCKISNKESEQAGITLVALVITIVVLLILAGVSIKLVLDNSGIATKAGDASSKSKEEGAKEKIELMLSDYYMESLKGETDLVSFLEAQDGVDSVTDNKDGTVTVKIGGQEVIVNSSKLKTTVAAFDRYKTEGKIEVVFIDMDNKIISSPLEPKLVGNMKPIKLNSEGTDFEETQKSDWGYNYVAGQGTQENTQSIWANAQANDGSMFVWIPRYAYKITYYDTDGTTVLGYSNAEGIVDVNGNVIQENDKGIQTVGDYIVHPAFTSNATIGGGFDDGSRKGVTGLWVGKFETTGTASEPTVKAGEKTLKSQTANEQYQTGKNAKFGESATINSHMAKNSEWGAVAYLAHSQYGTNGKKVEQNTKNRTTSGGTKTVSTIYTDYVNNSTTHNAYGIYDLNGGAYERVASYVNNGGTYLLTNGGTTEGDLYGATDAERSTSTAYKTVYNGIGTRNN